ncbi:hypothetical protein HJG60_009366 [Phyllostomus discolor]|uniref:Uncharacterized protein n=1 Tax=Phyllostomus discolor TaxID=89673 RepID=A0A833YL73_9CHIR|nr:hypothetical protein HJG60_009366 [Phyllostomus discolor]
MKEKLRGTHCSCVPSISKGFKSSQRRGFSPVTPPRDLPPQHPALTQGSVLKSDLVPGAQHGPDAASLLCISAKPAAGKAARSQGEWPPAPSSSPGRPISGRLPSILHPGPPVPGSRTRTHCL